MKKTDEKITKTDIIVGFIVVAFMIGLVVLSLYQQPKPAPQLQTIYLDSRFFPLTEYVSIGSHLVSKYSFYGTLLPNGTECINTLLIYRFNYSNQSLSATPEVITNPQKIANEYNLWVNFGRLTSPNDTHILIPGGNTTLLCPYIVNAIN